MTDKAKTGLELLRAPFPANQISKLPKPTKKQTDDLKKSMDARDFSLGIRCTLCGAWHHRDVVHLDYVGHAALTDRLLDADPHWSWEPMACGPDGLPALDRNGGMWIRLTICGVTRIGYGSADGKNGGDAIKEVIGDALRNAGMRFGAALDLWHKGDLHGDADADSDSGSQAQDTAPRQTQESSPAVSADELSAFTNTIKAASDMKALQGAFSAAWKAVTDADQRSTLKATYDQRKATLEAADDFPGDERNAA